MYGNGSMGVQMGALPPVGMDQGMGMPEEYWYDPELEGMDPAMMEAPPPMMGGGVTGFPRSAWSEALHQGMAEGLGIRQILASFDPAMYGRYNPGGAQPPAPPNPMMAGGMGMGMGMEEAPAQGPSTPFPMTGTSMLPPAQQMGGMVPPEMAGAMPQGRGLMGALGRRGNPMQAERQKDKRRGRRGR